MTTKVNTLDVNGQATFSSNILTTGVDSTAVGTDLAIAGLQTGGILQLGTGSTRTSAINVGSATNTGAISLSTSTGAVNIGADQTTGAINIGTSINRINTAGGGAINIGTGASANAFGINVGNGTASVTIAGPVSLTSTSQATNIAGALNLTSTTNQSTFSGPLQLNKPILVGYSSVTPAATYLGGTIGGGFTATALGASIYAFPQSFQLPIGTYLFNLGGQMQYSTGTFTQNYSTIYTGITQYAKTTNITPYYFGTNSIVASPTPFFTGFNGNIVLAVTTASLWYTVGCTWAGTAGASVNSIIGVFTATRLY